MRITIQYTSTIPLVTVNRHLDAPDDVNPVIHAMKEIQRETARLGRGISKVHSIEAIDSNGQDILGEPKVTHYEIAAASIREMTATEAAALIVRTIGPNGARRLLDPGSWRSRAMNAQQSALSPQATVLQSLIMRNVRSDVIKLNDINFDRAGMQEDLEAAKIIEGMSYETLMAATSLDIDEPSRLSADVLREVIRQEYLLGNIMDGDLEEMAKRRYQPKSTEVNWSHLNDLDRSHLEAIIKRHGGGIYASDSDQDLRAAIAGDIEVGEMSNEELFHSIEVRQQHPH
jgi:hypothetical protein